MQSSFPRTQPYCTKSCLVASVPIAPTPGSQPYWIQEAIGQPLSLRWPACHAQSRVALARPAAVTTVPAREPRACVGALRLVELWSRQIHFRWVCWSPPFLYYSVLVLPLLHATTTRHWCVRGTNVFSTASDTIQWSEPCSPVCVR
jgi:hypothetical protein